MNESQIRRIAKAITLERVGEPANQGGSRDRQSQGKDFLSRARRPGPYLRDGHARSWEVGGDRGEGGDHPEADAMRRRFLFHVTIAVAIILAAMAFQIVWRM